LTNLLSASLVGPIFLTNWATGNGHFSNVQQTYQMLTALRNPSLLTVQNNKAASLP